jgi:hypothetical protein
MSLTRLDAGSVTQSQGVQQEAAFEPPLARLRWTVVQRTSCGKRTYMEDRKKCNARNECTTPSDTIKTTA